MSTSSVEDAIAIVIPMKCTKGDLREADWAYLAGILDGDGCIYTHGQSGVPICEIVQSDAGFLHVLQRKYGAGHVYEKPTTGSLAIRRCYQWRVVGGDAAKIIVNILPFLIVKRDRALALGLSSDDVLPRGANYVS